MGNKISSQKLTEKKIKGVDSEKGNESESNGITLPKNLTWSDTIPFIVPLSKGKVIKVYDGDTITLANRLSSFKNDTIFRFSVRINGIDAPEIKGKNDDEISSAKIARDALSKLILGKYVTLDNVSMEKYGRVLADVYCNGICIGDWMIDKRYAVPYDGGKKVSPQNWKKYFETGDMGEEVVEIIEEEEKEKVLNKETAKKELESEESKDIVKEEELVVKEVDEELNNVSDKTIMNELKSEKVDDEEKGSDQKTVEVTCQCKCQCSNCGCCKRTTLIKII